jgi:hypothetical protein
MADPFNQEGQVSAFSKPFTGSMIKWVRYANRLPSQVYTTGGTDCVTTGGAFPSQPHVVYYWIDRGVIQARALSAAGRWIMRAGYFQCVVSLRFVWPARRSS